MNSLNESVLCYGKGRRSQERIKRRFIKWRAEQDPPVPSQCDNPECPLHNSPLVWNGKTITLILDHKNGVSGDNRPKNLQLLCPNCNSQQPTQGGRNKGRTQQNTGSFSVRRGDGKRDHTMPAIPGVFPVTGLLFKFSIKRKQSKS